MQRRRIKIGRDAGDERQHRAGGQAEGVEDRQHVEELVLAAEIDAGRGLRHVGQHVAVGQHDALGRAFRAGGEQDRRPVVGLARHQRLLPVQRAAQLVEERDGRANVLQIDDAHLLARAAATTLSSRPFSTKTREVRMVSTSRGAAGGQNVGGAGGEVDHRRHASGRHHGEEGHDARRSTSAASRRARGLRALAASASPPRIAAACKSRL